MYALPRNFVRKYRRGTRPTLGVDRAGALGPALRDLRLSQEVTQADAAANMTSTHATTVGAWENSRSIPTVRKLIELLAAYDYQIVFMHKRSLQELVRPDESAD
jgi:transcriptional regulator with XRE-family HTH domain